MTAPPSHKTPVSFEDLFAPRSGDPTETVLDVRDVSVRFGGIVALDGVSFPMRHHELVAVIGPNGSGKSTLLNTVSGLVAGTVSGSVVFRGRPMLGRSPAVIAQAGVSRSFQDPSLIDAESVITNVMLGAHLRLKYSMLDQIVLRRRVRRAERDARRRAETALEFMGLGHLAERRVAGLAYGSRKLIEIARAIVADPTLLLLDEPTSGLDRNEQAAVGEILRRLHALTEVTILVVEHHLDVVRQIADKVVAMESGQVVAVGSPEEVLASDAYRDAARVTPADQVAEDLSTNPRL